MLQPLELQRVRHNLVTEQKQPHLATKTELFKSLAQRGCCLFPPGWAGKQKLPEIKGPPVVGRRCDEGMELDSRTQNLNYWSKHILSHTNENAMKLFL